MLYRLLSSYFNKAKYINSQSHDSSVSIVTGYRMDERDSILVRTRIFLFATMFR